MYLEISPRQCGKTKRLIDAVIAHVYDGNVAYIQTIDKNHFRSLLKDRLKSSGLQKELNYNNIIYAHDQEHMDNLVRGLNIESFPRVFADEFDLIGDRLILNMDGYYCGTPKRMRSDVDFVTWMLGERKDLLLDAIEMNGGKHETYSPTNYFLNRTISDIRNIRRSMGNERYRNEIFGNIYV